MARLSDEHAGVPSVDFFSLRRSTPTRRCEQRFAIIPCALKIARFPPATAVQSRLSLHPPTPRICPGEPERYTYKDGGTRTFSGRDIVVVANILREPAFQVAFVNCDDVIQEIAPATPYPTLCDSILPRTFERSAERIHPQGSNRCGDLQSTWHHDQR